MSTTLPHIDDERIRDYPADDDACDTDPYLNDDYNWTGWPADSRWRPATAVLGAVVALGAIATAVIINSGDSASTKATVGAPAPHPVTSAPATTKASVPPRAAPGPAQLPPETVTTVTTPSAAPSIAPPAVAAPTVAPPLAAAPPAAALNPRTVIYSVNGTKQLLDLVNIVYTDARGVPQTEFNVSLPWSRAVVLNPGVETESVVATSFYGRLSCSIFNAAGQRVIASNVSNMATCAS
ncbi:MmpS family transport accessory protein [Mycobacterium sp. 94-17]|uniref:MmpS family transport accessory protein n=1 Tax=Mycobacterium sp. 94-17 TaxID=2986147 RepID=UPI002D1F7587|nr:MmpS family transport accessory protein [Mycobacterium sp. 94-17]MEB4211783.1 MmpS family transport accessory protein [Mycobacterium sp. 94-17]